MERNNKRKSIIISTGLMIFLCISGLSESQAQEILTLEKAMQIALESSPDMKQTELQLIRSRENLNAQRARMKSQFSMSLNPFGYNKVNRFDQQTSEWYLNESMESSGTFSVNQRILPTDGVLSLRNSFSYDYSFTESEFAIDPVSKTYNNNLVLALTQPIFTYNQSKMQLETVELDYESTLIRYLIMKLSLEKSVAEEFFSVYSSQMSLEIAEEELKNNEESNEIIRNKVEGGLLALEELYQAEVNLLTSRSSVYTANLNLQNSKDRFKVSIGMPLQEDFILVAEVSADTVAVDLDMAITHALKNRMELRESEISIQNAYNNLTQAKATNEFAGSITASVGVQSNQENFKNLFSTPTTTPNVGLTLEIPIFDWGERKSVIKAAEASLESVKIDHEVEKTNIELNIRQIVRNLKNLENQVVIRDKNVENAQLTYDINLERYRNGDLTSLDLGMYMNQLSDAKLGLTNAIIDYKIELLNLKIQTLYDFEAQKNIIPKEFSEYKK